ncbi:hypothetical protein MLD38_007711 [Melastoma candidum]|uniref:Uncharacterized protein n=1 Tax=Melastoma candidum TaxID=119954 RepID=A0ACB9RS42_9MYRT|nr:hypothetical protein MLD38_007711 [Melastoma candidum]
MQSNALAALEAIDMEVAEEVMRAGCLTGDQIDGLIEGASGTCRTRASHDKGHRLDDSAADSRSGSRVLNHSNVVDFEDDGDKVTVVLENSQRFKGNILVRADEVSLTSNSSENR